jgi:hypothetical protein
MAEDSKTVSALGGHGAVTLPAVDVDSYFFAGHVHEDACVLLPPVAR